jgi:hypothetical protein
VGVIADKVVVELEAKIAGFRQQVADAGGAYAATMNKIKASSIEAEGVTGRIFGSMKTAIVGFAASVVAVSFSGVIRESLEYAGSLGEVAQQLGVSSEALQVYRFAGTQVGITTEEMDTALTKMTRSAGDAANGIKAPAEAFNKLGVNVKDANGHIKATDQIMSEVADGLHKISDPAARAAIEVDLLGRAGQRLDTLLAGGSRAIDELSAAAHRLGLVLSEEQIAHADETADKLSALEQVLKANIAGAVADNANAILKLVDALIQLVSWAGQATAAWGRFEDRIKVAQGYEREAIGRGLQQQTGGRFGDRMVMQGQSQRIYAQEDLAASQMQQRLGFSWRDLAAGAQTARRSPSAAGLNAVAGSSGTDKAAEAAERAAEALRRWADMLDRDQMDLSRANSELIANRERAADFEIEMVERDRDRDNRDAMAMKDIDEAHRKQLVEANNAVADARIEVINQKEGERLRQQEQDILGNRLKTEEEAAQLAVELATTTRERHEAELRLLDIQQQEERLRLQGILDSGFTTRTEKADANNRLSGLEQRGAQQREQVDRRYISPGQQYVNELTDAGEQINNAVEAVGVQGLRNFNAELAKSIAGFLHLGGVAGSFFDTILEGLINIALQEAVIKPIASSLFGSGAVSTVVGALLPARAAGGYAVGGQTYLVGEHGPEPFTPAVSGRIQPANTVAAGGSELGQVVNYHEVNVSVSAPGANAQTVQLIEETMRQAAPALLTASTRNTMRVMGRRRL